MKVFRTIIHQIEKKKFQLSATLKLSNQLLAINNEVEKLSENLNNAFSKESKIIRTEFQELENHFFKDHFDTALSNEDESKKFTDISFELFAKKTIGDLNLMIQVHPFALGGYYVYSHYESFGRNYLGIFIVRDTEKVIFKRDPKLNVFTVNTTTIIDTDKLSMACRIDIEKYINKEERYLQFTNYKQQEISDYFVNWLEASQVSKIAEDTKTFIRIIDNIDLPIDPETGNEYEEDKFRSNLYSMVIAAGGILRIKEISSQYWEDENHLFDYIEKNGIDINGEFRISRTIFNQLNKFEVATGKIKLSFSKGDWKRGTVRRGDSGQIIIESQKLRAKIDALIDGTDD